MTRSLFHKVSRKNSFTKSIEQHPHRATAQRALCNGAACFSCHVARCNRIVKSPRNKFHEKVSSCNLLGFRRLCIAYVCTIARRQRRCRLAFTRGKVSSQRSQDDARSSNQTVTTEHDCCDQYGIRLLRTRPHQLSCTFTTVWSRLITFQGLTPFFSSPCILVLESLAQTFWFRDADQKSLIRNFFYQFAIFVWSPCYESNIRWVPDMPSLLAAILVVATLCAPPPQKGEGHKVLRPLKWLRGD